MMNYLIIVACMTNVLDQCFFLGNPWAYPEAKVERKWELTSNPKCNTLAFLWKYSRKPYQLLFMSTESTSSIPLWYNLFLRIYLSDFLKREYRSQKSFFFFFTENVSYPAFKKILRCVPSPSFRRYNSHTYLIIFLIYFYLFKYFYIEKWAIGKNNGIKKTLWIARNI